MFRTGSCGSKVLASPALRSTKLSSSLLLSSSSSSLSLPGSGRRIGVGGTVSGCNFRERNEFRTSWGDGGTPLVICRNKGGSSSSSSSSRKNNYEKGRSTSTTGKQSARQTTNPIPKLNEIKISLEKILSTIAKLNNSSSLSSSSSKKKLINLTTTTRRKGTNFKDEQVALLESIREVMEAVIASVDQGILNPSGKHGKELSKILELILFSYSQVDVPDLLLFDECQDVLSTLRLWNLDVRDKHNDYAIAVANKEQRWREGADLFWKQIDPGAGFTPVTVSIQNPRGLYSIARWAQEEQEEKQNVTVAEHVFDAVQQLTMVSPSDKPAYILAAGTALGHAGEWEAAVEYFHTSYAASQLGEPLTASTMQACLLCNKPEEAWKIFEETTSRSSNDIAGQWQWGGERDRIDPLLRDMAMRSAGTSTGQSGSVLEFYKQCQEEDVTISLEALVGTIRACERDGDVDGAILLFCDMLSRSSYSKQKNRGLVDGTTMMIGDINDDMSVDNSTAKLSLPSSSALQSTLYELLSSTMRTCNGKSLYGTSLFCLRLFELAYDEKLRRLFQDENQAIMRNNNNNANISEQLDGEKSLLFILSDKELSKRLLVPSLVAYSGLECYDTVLRICETVFEVADRQKSHQQEVQLSDDVIRNCRLLNEYVQRRKLKYGRNNSLGSPWSIADKELYRLMTSVDEMSSKKNRSSDIMTNKDRKNNNDDDNVDYVVRLRAALARTMKVCTYANQFDLSLRLLRWVDGSTNMSTTTIQESMYDKKQSGLKQISNVKSQSDMAEQLLRYKDSVYAETIYAERMGGNYEMGTEMFRTLLDSKETELSQWKQSCSAGLEILITAGAGHDAVAIFKEMDPSAHSVRSYIVIGQFLQKEKKWDELTELYRTATEHGYMSEQLGLLAMNAVVSSTVENRMRVLRLLVNENAQNVGLDPISWMRSRYWHVKRAIGFNYARLLMWWNDPETCHLDELNHSIIELETSISKGFAVRPEILRTILDGAKNVDIELIESNVERWHHIPATYQGWVDLIETVLIESASSTSLSSSVVHNTTFIRDVVVACQHLGCSKVCVDFARYLLRIQVLEDCINNDNNNNNDNGKKKKKKRKDDVDILQIILDAAKSENETELINDIQKLRGHETE